MTFTLPMDHPVGSMKRIASNQINPNPIDTMSKKINNLDCLEALANVNPAKSAIKQNKDKLDAVVSVAHEVDGKTETVDVLLSQLNAAYVGMVKLWPKMKEVKDAVETAQREARDNAKKAEREAKKQAEAEAKAKAKADREAEAKAKREAKEKEKADRAKAKEAEAKAKAEAKEAEAKAKREAKEKAEAEAKAKEEAKKKADTEKATKAAKKLSREGRL